MIRQRVSKGLDTIRQEKERLSKMKLSRIQAVAAMAITVAVGFSGCGDTSILVPTPEPSPPKGQVQGKPTNPKPIVIVQEAEPSAPAAPAAPPGSTFTKDCGYGIKANGVTSCDFAFNVHEAWGGGGPGVYVASSPVTGSTYDMSCDVGDISVICSEINATDGSNDAAVLFPSYG